MAREITRQSNGSGKIAKSALRAALSQFQVAYRKQHVYRLLKAGEGRYWTMSGKSVYLTSYQRLATTLSLLAEQQDRRLVATNRPGVADVYLDVSGTLEQFEANAYRSWLYYRDYPTISREQLSILFGRTAETLRRWESDRLAHTVTKRANYAQCADLNDYPYPVPYYANSYVARVGQKRVMRVRWQLPNTYFTKGVKQHRHRGQSAKVRRTVNAVLKKHELQQPANVWRGGSLRCQLDFNRKLYFNSPSKLASYIEKNGGAGYLWLEENRHGHGTFDVSTRGIAETQAHERESFWVERDLKQPGGLKMLV